MNIWSYYTQTDILVIYDGWSKTILQCLNEYNPLK